MKKLLYVIALGAWISSVLSAAPLGTAFTYQGRLSDGTAPATGLYDLRFTLYDAVGSVGAVGGALTNAATSVTNGLFTSRLDFGSNIFTGDARWLELAIRTNGSAAPFEVMTPRNELTPAPHALYAASANAVATAASTALPPASRIATPASAALRA